MLLVHNPFFKKIQIARGRQSIASYEGIALKTLWYWGMCIGGVLLYPILPITWVMTISFIFVAVVGPVLIYCFPKLAFIGGSLYSIVQGYLLTLFCQTYIKEYTILIWLAIGITILIFVTVFLLYLSGVVRVNRKLRAIFLTLLLISIVGLPIIYLSSFFTNTLSDVFLKNGWISWVAMIGVLLLTVVNLVFEFDYTVRIVTKGACKKYEWIAAYGLFMSVLLIFIRILEIFERFSVGEEK